MSKVRDGSDGPRAVVHKRILEVADARPDASLTEIADDVSGATPDLVERVLAEYGDPQETMSQNGQSAPDQTTGEESADDQPAGEESAEDPTVTTGELTDKQLETVRVVREHPDATQERIADLLDVTRATVSRRLNDIPGFEWTDRATFTTNLFDTADYDVPERDDAHGDEADSGEQTATVEADRLAEVSGTLERIEGRLDSVEGRLDDEQRREGEQQLGDEQSTTGTELPPELAHKVVHAAMESDRITEDEELELIATLLGR